jgi:hydrogenase expression/formation protein HypE
VIIVASEQEGLKIVELLKRNKSGLKSAIIGRVVNDHQGKVVLKNETGGRRIIDSLSGDQLPRIC